MEQSKKAKEAKKEMEAKPVSAIDRLLKLEKDLATMKRQIYTLNSIAQETAAKLASSEQSFSSIAKLMQALTEELADSKVIDSGKVMDRVNKNNEDLEASRIQKMVEAGFIVPVESVSVTSMVAISQKATIVDGNTKTEKKLAGYRIVEISNPMNAKELREAIVGKKVGETMIVSEQKNESKSTTIELTVLAIYEIKTGEHGSELPPQQ